MLGGFAGCGVRVVAAVAGVLPAGGLAVVGPGAYAAARGVLVEALSAAAVGDPAERLQVVITGEALTGLLGVGATQLAGWRRVRVAGGAAKALQVAEVWLLETARVTLARETASVPASDGPAALQAGSWPMLLVAHVPGSRERRRIRAVMEQAGHLFGVLLLGPWDQGPVAHVETDGTTMPVGNRGPATVVPPRMRLLDEHTTVQTLLALRQAETDRPPPAAPPGQVVRPVDEERAWSAAPQTTTAGYGTGQPARAAPRLGSQGAAAVSGAAARERRSRAVVRVLGPPEIVNARAAGRPVRQAALELLVYLAAHPDGATVEQICDDLWPGVRRFHSGQRLHTAASNLRHLLAAAAGADPQLAGEYLGTQQGGYRLNPRLVDVDLWRLREAVATARASGQDPDRRHVALRQACQAYGGPLADGCTYRWIGVYAGQVRTWACYALRDLAEFAEGHERAAQLLRQAAQADLADEDTCREAMRACAKVGDGEGIRHLLNELTGHLDTAGAAPAPATVSLARQLLRQLQ